MSLYHSALMSFMMMLVFGLPEKVFGQQNIRPYQRSAGKSANARPTASKPSAGEEVVDLNAVEAPRSAPGTHSVKGIPSSAGGVPDRKSPFGFPGSSRSSDDSESPIRFKVYFDLNLYSRPGITDLSFENFHAFLFMEGTPMPDMQFSFDVSPNPRFYELDWSVRPNLQLRMGKIWIPFDDTQIHNIYGGRVNVSRLQVGSAFLPDIWSDLGAGLKWTVKDVKDFNLIADFYVVNGFRSSGSDPVNPANPYPSFSDLPNSTDNNSDKTLGGRLHGLFWNRLGLGVSALHGRWSDQSQPSLKVMMYEGDAQYRLPPTMSEIRLGVMSMKVDLKDGVMYRAGTYLEYGQYLNRDRTWKFLVRGGTLQTDDRILDVSDQRILGATIIWRPSVIQFSLEHSRDLQKVTGKTNYSFTNLRMAIMF